MGLAAGTKRRTDRTAEFMADHLIHTPAWSPGVGTGEFYNCPCGRSGPSRSLATRGGRRTRLRIGIREPIHPAHERGLTRAQPSRGYGLCSRCWSWCASLATAGRSALARPSHRTLLPHHLDASGRALSGNPRRVGRDGARQQAGADDPVPASRALLRHLREATEDLHAAAERRVRILDEEATTATYARYLTRMLGFQAPVEDALAEHGALARLGFDAPARRKQDWLTSDLRVLGIDPASVARCPRAPVFADTASALGVAYVLEGATLGGRFILAHAPGPLARLRGTATRFFEGYREETGAMWRRFGLVATLAIRDGHEEEEPAIARAIAGARVTFAELAIWLDEPEREPPFPRPRVRRSPR